MNDTFLHFTIIYFKFEFNRNNKSFRKDRTIESFRKYILSDCNTQKDRTPKSNIFLTKYPKSWYFLHKMVVICKDVGSLPCTLHQTSTIHA